MHQNIRKIEDCSPKEVLAEPAQDATDTLVIGMFTLYYNGFVHCMHSLTPLVTCQVEFVCNGIPIGNELSLAFIDRTVWVHRKQTMKITYRIDEDFLKGSGRYPGLKLATS